MDKWARTRRAGMLSNSPSLNGAQPARLPERLLADPLLGLWWPTALDGEGSPRAGALAGGGWLPASTSSPSPHGGEKEGTRARRAHGGGGLDGVCLSGGGAGRLASGGSERTTAPGGGKG